MAGRLNGVSYDLMARPRHVGNMHQSRAAERALHFIGGRQGLHSSHCTSLMPQELGALVQEQPRQRSSRCYPSSQMMKTPQLQEDILIIQSRMKMRSCACLPAILLLSQM